MSRFEDFNPKNPLQSKGVMGAVVAFVLSIFGMDFDPVEAATVIDIVTNNVEQIAIAIASLVALWGRLKAERPVTLMGQ